MALTPEERFIAMSRKSENLRTRLEALRVEQAAILKQKEALLDEAELFHDTRDPAEIDKLITTIQENNVKLLDTWEELLQGAEKQIGTAEANYNTISELK